MRIEATVELRMLRVNHPIPLVFATKNPGLKSKSSLAHVIVIFMVIILGGWD